MLGNSYMYDTTMNRSLFNEIKNCEKLNVYTIIC